MPGQQGRGAAAAPRLEVRYGSETGNARDAAERCGRRARARGLPARVGPLEPGALAGVGGGGLPVVIFISTTGQGECPQAARGFWRDLLRRALPPDHLAGTRFCVFGLGDSGYPSYNVMALKLERRLKQLGAERFLATGLGDDQHPVGYSGGLEPWLAGLWRALLHRAGVAVRAGPEKGPAALEPPRLRAELRASEGGGRGEVSPAEAARAAYVLDLAEAHCDGAEPATRDPEEEEVEEAGASGAPAAGGLRGNFHCRRPFMAKVRRNDRLTAPGHFQDVRHIEVDLTGGPSYRAGDVLGVLPETRAEDLDRFFSRARLDPAAEVRLSPATAAGSGEAGGGRWVRLRALVWGALDVAGAPPRQYFFEMLGHFASDEEERERLEYFGSPEGAEDLHRYCQGERRSVLEVLEDFPSVDLPLERLLEVVPRLQPRLYSISSGPGALPAAASLTVALVEYVTKYGLRRRGLCSAMLADRRPGGRLAVWTEEGAIPDLSGLAAPLLLVGPGTGVAPLRALLQERELAFASGGPPPEALLVFGCRNRERDFLYREEWERLERAGLLPGGAVVAFSRDQDRKVYVQDRLREEGARVWRVLEAGGHVYVCGSANKMPGAVRDALADVAAEHGGLGGEGGAAYVRALALKRRYHLECWS